MSNITEMKLDPCDWNVMAAFGNAGTRCFMAVELITKQPNKKFKPFRDLWLNEHGFVLIFCNFF